MNLFTLFIIVLMLEEPVIWKLTKYTTIGNHVWFGKFVSKIANRIQNKRYADFIVNFSYNKLFVCRPCHSFWLTFAIFMIYGAFTHIDLLFVFVSVLFSLFLYAVNETIENDKTLF